MLAAPLAWSAFIVVPALGWGWLDGVPLGRVEAAALALVWWAWAASRRLPGAWILAALVVAKIAAGAVPVDRGFTAKYYANDAWAAPVERSVEFPGADFTRRDDRLAFGAPGRPDLPLHFFNDLRFNYVYPTQPRRDRLAYSVEWRGYVHEDDAHPITQLYLDAGNGIAVDLSVDGNPVIRLEDPLPRSQPVDLTAGWHLIVLRLKAPYGASRRIEAGAVIDDEREPFDQRRIVVRPVGAFRMATEKVLYFASCLADIAVLVWLGLTVAMGSWRAVQARSIMPLLWLAAFVESVAYGWRHGGGLEVLTAGDDWLAYESYSRAIALGDWIGAGQPEAFYYQPLYSYFLALTHLLFGDSLFGAVFVQRLLLAATVAWVVRMTTDFFGRRSGSIALFGGGVFLYAKVGPWTYELLTENLFVPLLVGWVAMLSRPATNGTPIGSAIAAGLVGGIATLTRSTLLLAWPPALLLWAASLKARRLQTVGALLMVMVAIVGTATLRNWVVSDKFVLVASSLGINLYLGNTPREPLDPEPPHRTRLYERLGVEGHVRTVAEFAAQRPDEFIQHLGNKALYTIGFFRRSQLPGGDNMGTSWLYVGTWVFAVAGVGRLILGVRPTSSPAVWIAAVTALTHFAVMVVIIPFGYGDRYVLPLYPLLIPYAAFALDAIAAAFQGVARATPQAMEKIRALGTSAHRHVATLAATIAGNRRLWLYVAYVAAVTHWLSWRPANPNELDLGTALLLPICALVVSRYAGMGAGVPGGTIRLVAIATAACTTGGVLLLLFFGLEEASPARTPAAFAEAFGPVGALCCVGLAFQAALVWPGRRPSRVLVGGSLLIVLLALAHTAPGMAARAVVMMLVGLLLGGVEAAAVATSGASGSARSR